jgi:RHS repeat-associated protein
MSENAILKYIQLDHLTGTSVMTSANGTWLGTIKYTPFGETRSITGIIATDKKFTGQELDDTGLYFYNARYYEPTIGRFISPDTVIPSPSNPQCFNRYTYCLNNPLRYTDPSGNIRQGRSGIGTTTINGVGYTITQDQNGYYVEGKRGDSSGAMTFKQVIEAIGSEMEYYGDCGVGGNAKTGAVVTINVQTNLGVTVPVHYIPEAWIKKNSMRPDNLQISAKGIVATILTWENPEGITIDFLGGVYVRYQLPKFTSDINALYASTMHESEHYFEQISRGFPWYFEYISGQIAGIPWGLRPAEIRANEYERSGNPNFSFPSNWDNVKQTYKNILKALRISK